MSPLENALEIEWEVSIWECTTKSEMSPLENAPQSEMSPQREGERKSVSSREFTTKSMFPQNIMHHWVRCLN